MSDSAFPGHFGANKKMCNSAPSLLNFSLYFSFSFANVPKLLYVFVQIAKCICPNCKIYLFKLLNVFVQIGKCFLFKLLNVFVQISTFSPQPLPLLLLFLFQFLSWKSADLEFLKELSGLNSFQPYLANKKKGGGEEVGKCFKATFAFKIYAKTILSRKF